MFTVGIYSTHLPYIAFVLFYAVFFLFGIEKESAGELIENRQIVSKENSLISDFKTDILYENIYRYDAWRKENINKLLIPYKEKSKVNYSVSVLFDFAVSSFSHFSRPPPVA